MPFGMSTNLALVMIQAEDKLLLNDHRNTRFILIVEVVKITRLFWCVHRQLESKYSFLSFYWLRFSFRCLAPYIIYRGARLYDTWCPRNGFAGTRYNVTDSGWVDEKVFYDWFIHQFIPSVKMIKRPIILLFDGHSAHISTRIIKTAMDNQIELKCLPPHTTTILQPVDVATLTKVKTAWCDLLNKHNLKTNSAPIDKTKFALMARKSLAANRMSIVCF